MSEIRVNRIVSYSGDAEINITQGLAASSNASFSGIVTASSFSGDGSGLTGVTAVTAGTATTTTNIPNLTGDITSVNTTTTLATVNSDIGTFGSSTTIPSITVNAKGLVTGVSTSPITVTPTDTLDDVTSRGNTTSNGISVGFITATNLTLSGDLTVNGNTTTINSTILTVDDKNIVIASGAANDAAADGGGITLESGDGDKTLNWINATDSWTSSENLDLASGKTYKINTAEVLSSTTLGSSIINSSLTSVGTLGQLSVSGVVTATSFEGDGSQLTGIAAGGGGSGEFNTGVSSSVQLTPLSYETSIYTFPSAAGKQYVIESINVANVDTSVGVGTTVNIIASIEDSSGEQTYIAYNVPVSNGGLIELLKNPIVAGPSDVMKMWSLNESYIGVSNAVEVYMNYAEYTSTEYTRKYKCNRNLYCNFIPICN